MTGGKHYRWVLAIRRLDAIASTFPVNDLPDIEDLVLKARDQLTDEFGAVLAEEALRERR